MTMKQKIELATQSNRLYFFKEGLFYKLYNQGVLIPRMTKAQITANSPRVVGLIVYCSDCDIKSLYVYDGTNYINLINGGETVAYEPFNKAVSPWDKKYVRLAIVTLPEYPAKHVAMRFGKSMP